MGTSKALNYTSIDNQIFLATGKISSTVTIEDVGLRKKPNWFWRIIVGIIIFMGIAGISIFLLFRFFPQIPFVFIMKNNALKASSLSLLNTLPEERIITTNTVPNDQSSEITYADYSFKAPWKDIKDRKQLTNSLFIGFSNKKILLLLKPISEKELINDNKNDEKYESLITSVYGTENINTDYKIYNIILQKEYDDMPLFKYSSKRTLIEGLFLFDKAILYGSPGEKGETKIYNFNLGRVQAIEVVNVTTNRYQIDFFKDESIKGRILSTSSGVTQQDIDFIISSIHFSQ